MSFFGKLVDRLRKPSDDVPATVAEIAEAEGRRPASKDERPRWVPPATQKKKLPPVQVRIRLDASGDPP